MSASSNSPRPSDQSFASARDSNSFSPLFAGPQRSGALKSKVARPLFAVLGAGIGLLLSAHATEGGGTAFPNGGEDFNVAAMPPPGWYGLFYYNHYTADRLLDGAGRNAVPEFNLQVNAFTPRLDWVKSVSWLGADRWGTLFLAPLLDVDLSLRPAPGVQLRGAKRRLGDLTMGNGLHWTFSHFEMINSIDVVAPTGSYRAGDLVNAGQNHWSTRFNHMGSWRPAPAWDISWRLHTDIAFENRSTNYRSGQTVYLNWAAGWQLRPRLTVGLAGYFLRQVTDDRQNGRVVGPDGHRVRADGLGPCVRYILPNHVMLTAKYFREFEVRHHPKGQQFWFYAAVPLGSPPR